MIRQREAAVRGGHRGPASAWRGALRRELTLWLCLKVAVLAVLWGLFFSPAHRVPVTAATASDRFALKSPGASPAPRAVRPGGAPR